MGGDDVPLDDALVASVASTLTIEEALAVIDRRETGAVPSAAASAGREEKGVIHEFGRRDADSWLEEDEPGPVVLAKQTDDVSRVSGRPDRAPDLPGDPIFRAFMLAPTLEICEALLRGKKVHRKLLDPEWARRFGL